MKFPRARLRTLRSMQSYSFDTAWKALHEQSREKPRRPAPTPMLAVYAGTGIVRAYSPGVVSLGLGQNTGLWYCAAAALSAPLLGSAGLLGGTLFPAPAAGCILWRHCCAQLLHPCSA